jgi:bifunctional NMN adenylyltransferase/nudix hydrolase
MKKPYNTLVLIGRFQAPHNAHFELLERAGKLADQVIIIIGSAKAPRTFKNPWTYQERIDMLSEEVQRLSDFTSAEYVFEYNDDTLYDDDAWVARIQETVSWYTNNGDRIGIIGHKKDLETKRYLEMFPQWEEVPADFVNILDATQIREMYFSDKFNSNFLVGVMPQSVISFLIRFRSTEEFQNILEEKRIVDSYREKYKSLPYPVVNVTCDAVVTQSGHILLIKRRSHPGKGLWALPGGYFDAVNDDTPLDGIIRELKEETGIDVPDKVLRGSIKSERHFSAKNRSQLGRSITFAAHISLQGGEWKLPKIKGADDAEKAKWVPFVSIKREELFDDHYDIITNFVPLIR